MRWGIFTFLFLFCCSANAQQTIGYPHGIPTESGAVPVIIQDQYSEPIDLYLCDVKGETNPASPVSIGDTVVTVDSATGAVLYGCIDIIEGGHVFQSLVTNISGTDITFSSQSDYVFTTSADIMFGDWDLSNADGSVTPIEYIVAPPAGAIWDVYTITVSMEDNAVMYESTFGGIPALTNGLAGTIVDGTNKQLFLVSNNGGFREYAFDTQYPGKVPAGTYAFGAEKNFKNKNGVSLRLDGDSNDMFKIPVRDDLTDNTKIAVTIHGHRVINDTGWIENTTSLTQNTWVKIAENKTNGIIYLQGNYYYSSRAYFVYVESGESAPVIYPGQPGSTAAEIKNESLTFSNPVPIDIYLWSPDQNTTAVVYSK